MKTSKYTVKVKPQNATVTITVSMTSQEGVVTTHTFKAAECVHLQNAQEYFDNYSKAVRAIVRMSGGHSEANRE